MKTTLQGVDRKYDSCSKGGGHPGKQNAVKTTAKQPEQLGRDSFAGLKKRGIDVKGASA